jgi:hypothetical protein
VNLPDDDDTWSSPEVSSSPCWFEGGAAALLYLLQQSTAIGPVLTQSGLSGSALARGAYATFAGQFSAPRL